MEYLHLSPPYISASTEFVGIFKIPVNISKNFDFFYWFLNIYRRWAISELRSVHVFSFLIIYIFGLIDILVSNHFHKWIVFFYEAASSCVALTGHWHISLQRHAYEYVSCCDYVDISYGLLAPKIELSIKLHKTQVDSAE